MKLTKAMDHESPSFGHVTQTARRRCVSGGGGGGGLEGGTSAQGHIPASAALPPSNPQAIECSTLRRREDEAMQADVPPSRCNVDPKQILVIGKGMRRGSTTQVCTLVQ